MIHNLVSIIASSRRRVTVDPDAADYFARIVAAGSTISAGNQAAVNAFVVGCKADGIWSAIKASCILAGADDLTGALVPLVGAAPTNFNFVAGDYSRTTGLKGDGLSKNLNANRDNAADPQNSKHIYARVSEIDTTGAVTWHLIGTTNVNGGSHLRYSSGFWNFRANGTLRIASSVIGLGGYGCTRNNSTDHTQMEAGVALSFPRLSSLLSGETRIFARSGGFERSNARLSFYSIGEHLDLTLLDARLTTLMSSLT